jgi:hypothetical protein
MKKLLLSIAAGIFILSLPIIASATVNNTFDEYSGYTAHITVHGFQSYSTSAGKYAKVKPFAWTEKADTTLTGPKNTWAQMSTVNSGGTAGEVFVWLNAHTVMEIIITNAIAPANGKVIRANALYLIVHTSGDMTLDSNGSFNTPASVGLTGAEDFLEGGCTITASNNLTTHNMVLSISSATTLTDGTETYTSVSGSPDSWSQTGVIADWVAAPAASISPIKLSPTSGFGYSGPWWNLNSGGIF